jgi:biopolymer transport protein ExbB/TolQ
MFSLAAIQEMWANAWPVISLLLACSVFSGAVILERWFTLRRFDFDRDALLERLRKLLGENKRESAVTLCEGLRRPIGRILAYVLQPSAQDRAAGREYIERVAFRMIRTETARMNHYLIVLGTIGSISPFVGLFGTVVGIIHAFRAIAENAGGGPGVVANGIAEALITTALGLFVAIPAIVAYNAYGRKVERISEDMELCVQEILDLTGAR